MTLIDFIANNRRKVLSDPSGNYPNECVSLWKQYQLQVNGIDPIDLYVPDDRAKNIWFKTTPAMLKHFDKVNTPAIGDTAVYDGNYGDVAIYIGNGKVFGQLGTPVFKPADIRPLGKPLGYLRLRGSPQGEDMFKGKTAEQWCAIATRNQVAIDKLVKELAAAQQPAIVLKAGTYKFQ